jgi:serine/threonine protein kinase/tetratricopeptide (TPR) repeat protein
MMTAPAQDLFAQARELPVSERDAFLVQACGDNAELHLEVQRLLVDAARADSFFGDENGATLGAEEFKETYAEKESDQVGPYKLRQAIGEGGFGTVWMAEQSVPISRMVALKVIKAGMDTKQVLARFEAERQALAMMDHPNIAKVLDAGATSTGRPYFAMELVKGIPITDYCDQAGLGTKERLALFRDVCSAINHAHQKGIIHRDIKPSNVMVTLYADKPVVKVIDFGIAKATQCKLTEKTLFTRFEQFIGTPVYMSPEQASLSAVDIDTRSDIYALGVLLYELLVGKPPFDGKSLLSVGYEEMRRIIREVEPVKPSSRLGTLVGEERTQLAKARHVDPAKVGGLIEPDLDWIVMKAIEKDRTRRYETANAFAQDIVRFLSDQPVTATPPSAGYQFRKFARRNKTVLRVAAAIAAVLVAATLVSTWHAVKATRAEKMIAETLNQVAAERDAKEQARKDAEDILKFLGDVFQSPDPTRDGREIKVVELLDKAAKKLETDLSTQPAQRAKLQRTLARTYYSLGLAHQAIPLIEKARDYHLDISGPEHPDTLSAMGSLAISYHAAGRREEALRLREEMLPLYRKALGREHADTLEAMNLLALGYMGGGHHEKGIKLLEELLPSLQKLNGPDDIRTLDMMEMLAICLMGQDRDEEALKLLEEVLHLRRQTGGPEDPQALQTMINLAGVLFSLGRMAEGLKLQEDVLPLSLKIKGPEHPGTLRAQSLLAGVYGQTDRPEEALRLQEEVVPLHRKVNGPEHPETLEAMGNLAVFLSDVGRQDEALKLREEVLTSRRKTSGPGDPQTLRAMGHLALSYRENGEVARAEALEKEIAAAKVKVPAPPPASK